MINNIQVLRAFAALNVVFFHTLGVANMFGYNTHFFNFLTNWGANGVDVFFVISGFVMVYIQMRSPKSSFEFLKNRIKRIVPLYWTLTAFLVCLFYFSSSSKFNLVHFLTSLIFVSRMFGENYPVIQQGWTLELEMFFYLVIAFAIFVKRQNTILITSLILTSLVIFNIINSIVIEFIFGMFVCHLYLNKSFQKYSLLFFIIGSVGLAISLFIKSDMNRVILNGLPAAFLVLSCCNFPQIKSQFLIFLGAASYSMYLIQAFTMPAFFEVARLLRISNQISDLLIILSLLFTAFVGCGLYYFYEKPLSKYLK